MSNQTRVFPNLTVGRFDGVRRGVLQARHAGACFVVMASVMACYASAVPPKNTGCTSEKVTCCDRSASNRFQRPFSVADDSFAEEHQHQADTILPLHKILNFNSHPHVRALGPSQFPSARYQWPPPIQDIHSFVHHP